MPDTWRLMIAVVDDQGFTRELSLSPRLAARDYPQAFRALLREMQAQIKPEQLSMGLGKEMDKPG